MSRSKKKPKDSSGCLEIYDSSEYCILGHGSSKLALVCYFLPCYGDAAVIQHAFTGDIVLGPQMPVRMLPYSPDAIAISDMLLLQQNNSHGWCPRRFLKMAELRLKQKYGLRVQVGFETECILLKRVEQKDGVDHFVPLETSVYCQSWGFDRAADVVREICSALEHYGGQKVIHAHGESAHGQFEFITGYGDVVTHADGFLIRKEIIQHVANKHGLFATFLPKYFEDQAGSASHVHVSVERVSDVGDVDFRGDNYGLSNDLARFMAGILSNLNALVLLTAGSPNSIRRMSPGCWAGAYTFWGYANKEAPLRMIDAKENHVEFKVFDGTANPYLGLCGLLCAGMDGLAQSRRYATAHVGGQSALIPAPIQVNPDTLQTRDDSMRRLPTSFEEAVLSFSENLMQWNQSGMMHEWFKACCDEDDESGVCTTESLRLFFDDYKMVKFAESERFKGMSFDEEVKILFDKY